MSVKVEQSKLDQFKDVAAAHERSVAQQIRWLMDQAIQNHKAAA